MKIHEHQARRLLQRAGVSVSAGDIVESDPKEAASLFKRFANPTCIAKVQVLMGGRGKAGGVERVRSPEEAQAFCEKFIGKPFSTSQSAGEPKTVRSILITEDIPFAAEYYLSIVIDRTHDRPVILFSKQGGVEIEEVAAKDQQAINKIHFMPEALPKAETVLSVISKDFAEPQIARQVAEIAERLAKLFVEKDASICEINPLVLTSKGSVLALDAKIVFDDNALFRHEDLRALKDPEEEDERESAAKEFNLNYVSMNGSVGCLVNGAGLAMATMDRSEEHTSELQSQF